MRKTSKDYRKELKDARLELASIEAHIIKRLQQLCETYPEAIITIIDGTEIKAKRVDKVWIEKTNLDDLITMIEKLENYSKNLDPFRQGKLEL